MKVYQPTPRGEIPLIKLIVYGMGNSGKTTFAYSFHSDPRTAPVLGLNIGGNPQLVAMWTNGPAIIDLEKYSDIDMPFDFLHSGQPERHPFRKILGIGPQVKFKTVVVDTFSDWQRDLIENITGDDAVSILSNFVAPEATKHGAKIMTGTSKIARNMILGLPLNVILVLQEQEKVDFATGAVSLQPSLYGQSRRMVTAWVTLMGQMSQVADKDKGGQPSPIITWNSPASEKWTKNQIAPGRLGRGMKNPTATKLLNLIETYYTELAGEEVITQDVLMPGGLEQEETNPQS